MGWEEGEKASGISKLLNKAKGYVAERLSSFPTPEANVTDVNFKAANLDSVDYVANVAVKNPYPHPIPVCQISYILMSHTRRIASGTMPDPGSLKAKDTTVVDVPVKIPYSVAISLVRDIGTDWDIDYRLDLGLTIDLPVVGDITIPLSTSGVIKLPTLKDLF